MLWVGAGGRARASHADNLWSVLRRPRGRPRSSWRSGRWVIGANDSDYVVSRRRAARAPPGPPRGRPRAESAGGRGRPGMLVVQLDGVAAPVLRAGHRGRARAEHRSAGSTTGDAPPRGLVGADPVDDPREPGRPAARRLGPDPGVPLVGPGPRPARRDQPPGGRRARRAAADRRARACSRAAASAISTMFSGRRRDGVRRDEPVAHQGPRRRPRPGTGVRAVLREPVRAGACGQRSPSARWSRSCTRPAASGSATCEPRDLPRAAGTSCCAASRTCCCGTSTRRSSPRRCCAAPRGLRRPRRLRRDRAPRRPDPARVAALARGPRPGARHPRAGGRRRAARLRDRRALRPRAGARRRPTSSSGARRSLDRVRALMAEPAADGGRGGTGEDWGPLNALVNSALNLVARVRGARAGPGAPEAAARRPTTCPTWSPWAPGTSALVWFPRCRTRLTLEDFQERWPGLVPASPRGRASGVVVVDTRGPRPRRDRPARPRPARAGPSADAVEGEDPLAAVRPARARRPACGRRGSRTPGDLLLISTVTDARARARVRGAGRLARRHRRRPEPRVPAAPGRAGRWTTSCASRVGDDEILVGAERGARAAGPLGGLRAGLRP